MKITLKAARVNAGLKQKDVAEKLGLTDNTIRSYEMGITKPNIATIKNLASLYGCEVTDFKEVENE